MSETDNLIKEYEGICEFDEIVMKHNENFNINTLEEIYNNTYDYKKYRGASIICVLGMDVFKQITTLNNTWNTNKYKMLRKIMELIRYIDGTINDRNMGTSNLRYQLYDLCLTLKYLFKIGDFNIHKDLGNHYLTPYEHCLLLNIPIVNNIFTQYG